MSGLTARFGAHLGLAGLCLGLATANAVRVDAPAAAALAAVTIAGACLVRRAHIGAVAAVLGVVGLAWGSARLEAIDRSPLTASIGHAGHVRAVITGPARRSPFDVRVPAKTQFFASRPVREPVLLRLPRGRAPPQGALVDVLAEVTEPRGPKNGFDERTYLRRHGIHVVLRASHLRVLGHRGGLAGVADRLRAYISRTMAPGLTGERRAVVAGVVLGEDEGLSRELADAFRASGLYHLLAVSGQNVFVIGGGVLLLAWVLGVARWVGEVAAVTAIVGYLAAVGWQPSVVRAGVAGVLGSLAWLAARPRDRWYFLLAGAAVLLAWNPYTFLDPGFQLSFGAVVAIFLAVQRVGGRLEGYPVPARAAEVLTVSLVCGLATAPILLWQFGAIPVYSVPANVLVAPAVAPLLQCGLLSAALHPVVPAACAPLSWCEGVLAAYVAAVARAVGGLPFARVDARGALVATSIVLIAVVLARGAARPRRSGELPDPRRE